MIVICPRSDAPERGTSPYIDGAVITTFTSDRFSPTPLARLAPIRFSACPLPPLQKLGGELEIVSARRVSDFVL